MRLDQSEELDSERIVVNIEVDNPEVLIDIPEYKEVSDSLKASMLVSETCILAQVYKADESADSVDIFKKETKGGVLSTFINHL